MIGAIMILAVVAYLVWTFWGRAFHVIGQYKKGGSQFKLSEPLDYEAIYQKLKERLQYPDNRNLFYDEFGQPSIAGRYGTYTIHTEDTLLTVQAETNGRPRRQCAWQRISARFLSLRHQSIRISCTSA